MTFISFHLSLVYCTANIGEADSNKMEYFASRAVRRHQEFYCFIDYQKSIGWRNIESWAYLCEQVELDTGSGTTEPIHAPEYAFHFPLSRTMQLLLQCSRYSSKTGPRNGLLLLLRLWVQVDQTCPYVRIICLFSSCSGKSRRFTSILLVFMHWLTLVVWCYAMLCHAMQWRDFWLFSRANDDCQSQKP